MLVQNAKETDAKKETGRMRGLVAACKMAAQTPRFSRPHSHQH